ncbi:hypothetical protein [Novosphingobium sp.]|uniref:hypothetical protein n=1 Tax=Novosphingobium sp. TaxID=1874826 RepID=UPI003D6D4F22
MTHIIKLDAPAYVLRTCLANMQAPSPRANGFIWPEAGHVAAPDFRDDKRCGGGLHGALWGVGDAGLFTWDADAKWLVVEVDHYIELDGKVKFREGNVVHCGDKASATSFIHAKANAGPIIGLTLTGGDDSTLTGGNRSTLTGGYGSTLTGGDGSTLTGGYGSTLTGGYGSTLTGGNRSTLTGGDDSTLTGGDDSTLLFRWWDGEVGRYRTKCFEVDGAEVIAGTAYRLNESGLLVPA